MSPELRDIHTPQVESIEARERKELISKAQEIGFFIGHSNLFRGNWELMKEVQNTVQDAVGKWDIIALNHIAETLKDERNFTLSYLRWLTQSSQGEISALEVQFSMQRAFIHKTVTVPETQDRIRSDLLIRDLDDSLDRLYA